MPKQVNKLVKHCQYNTLNRNALVYVK